MSAYLLEFAYLNTFLPLNSVVLHNYKSSKHLRHISKVGSLSGETSKQNKQMHNYILASFNSFKTRFGKSTKVILDATV